MSSAQGPMGGVYGRKITPEVVCHACHACVVEVEKILGLTTTSNRREVDVIDAIAGICDKKYFKIYDYPPLKMDCSTLIYKRNRTKGMHEIM